MESSLLAPGYADGGTPSTGNQAPAAQKYDFL
jgi:hypothetical protein